jgi:type IX secretion system PorP/SprF family membrane protein
MICAAHIAAAQQDPLSAQYLNNYFLINPAYAGFTKDLNLSAGYRLQWTGFSGSPVTMNATGHIALAENKMGAGFSIIQDQVGSNKTTQVNFAYAYRIRIDTRHELSFGLQGGATNYQADYSNLQIDKSDPKFTNLSAFAPNIGAGLMVRSEKFIVSIAIPHLLKEQSDPVSAAATHYSQNLYAFAAYMVPVSFRVKLKPSVLLRAVPDLPLSTDVGLAMRVDDSYTLGVFTRNLGTVGFQTLFNIGDALRVGYVFEMPVNSSTSLNFTSHEFMVGLRFKALRFHTLDEIRNF